MIKKEVNDRKAYLVWREAAHELADIQKKIMSINTEDSWRVYEDLSVIIRDCWNIGKAASEKEDGGGFVNRVSKGADRLLGGVKKMGGY